MNHTLRALPVRGRRGLTLIELVVVVAILAVLAALVVPRLDFLRNQAGDAAGAATAADLMNMLQTYRTSSGSYPMLDTLIAADGSVPTAIFSSAGSMVQATTLAGPATGAFYYQSFLNAGFVNTPGPSAYQHATTTTGLANGVSDAGNLPIDLISLVASGSGVVAEVVPPSSSGASPYNAAIYAAAFPNYSISGAPLDSMGTAVKLIAMGIGPNSGLGGGVMATTPLDVQPGDNAKTTYCRYLAIFAVYSDGKAAQLKMVVDHRGKTIDKRISQYNQSGPTGN
jgi:prepilin-type N-terminal cleavage/methylation domain-containing protein